MSDYKDSRELYQSVFDQVHAPDELKQRIKKMDTKRIQLKRIKLISAAAACLAVVMIAAIVIGSFTGGGNSFVLKASASEIGGDSFVKVAAVAPVGGESSSEYEGEKQIPVYNTIIPFPLFCDGRNIKSITYTVDQAVFLFPYDSFATEYRAQYPAQAAASDKITERTESAQKIESYIADDKQYASYTVSFDDQIRTDFNQYSDMQTFPIFMLARIAIDDTVSAETKAAYEHSRTKGSLTDESYLNELMEDMRVIYDEMLGRVTVTATITYEDGKTDSTTLRFSCLSADMQNGFVIGAKTIKS